MSLIYIIAGESSGDVLGARLIAALRARRPDLEFAGVGGEAMAAQGVTSLRQLGDQEVNIIPMVKGLTKYSVLVLDPGAGHRTVYAAGGNP